MPKSSTPALLPAMVSSFTPLSTNAAIRFSGMPQRPKPPAAMVMPSFSSPPRADFASGWTLFISGSLPGESSVERAAGDLYVRRLAMRRDDRGLHALHHRRQRHRGDRGLVDHLRLGIRDVDETGARGQTPVRCQVMQHAVHHMVAYVRAGAVGDFRRNAG